MTNPKRIRSRICPEVLTLKNGQKVSTAEMWWKQRARTGRTVSDSWCSRIALCKLRYIIETAEDLEKDYLPVSAHEIEEYDSKIKKWEDEWGKKHAA